MSDKYRKELIVMEYLLIMPRFIDRVGEWYWFPLGLPYISASMKQKGMRVQTMNLNDIAGDVQDIIKDYLKHHRIDVVLTGGLSAQYPSIKEILRTVRSACPEITIVCGGGIITSTPEVGMKVLEFVDYGIIGEGEITVCELCDYLAGGGRKLEDIDGIIYKNENGYVRTKPRQEIKNLDEIPFPDYDGFGFANIAQKMASLVGINSEHAITMLASRSCPFQCTFCFHTSGNTYRQRSLDNFFAELDLLVNKYDVKYIFISDELFAFNRQRAMEFCERIKPYGIKWWAQTRVNDVDEELVKMLKEANCVTMGFGLESADNRILKSMRKGIKIEQTEKALALVYKYGISIQGAFIFGDVEETVETASNTLKWWKEHQEYGIPLNFITAYPGTPLYKYAVKNGIIKDEEQFIKDGCPVVNLSKMSQEEMDWLASEIMQEQNALQWPDDIGNVFVDYKNGKISFNGKCVQCHETNQWLSVRIFTRNQLTCKKCGQKHKVPILPEIVNRIKSNVSELLKKHTVAFWGVNGYWSDLFPKMEFTEENLYLLDISRNKQGRKLADYIINSPEVIGEHNVDLVIVPVISIYETIRKMAEEQYPQAKVISILDVM